MCALACGTVLAEKRPGLCWGLCVIGMVYGLGKLLPDLLWLIPIRYFFVAFAGYGLVPMLFKKLGI